MEEFKNWGIEDVKEKFLNLLTVESDVFTINFAATVKINEEKNVVWVRRARMVVRREEGQGDEEPRLIVILPLEYRRDQIVIDYPDFPELERERLEQLDFNGEFGDLAAEDMYWNPFRFEFYVRNLETLQWLPPEK